MGAALRSSRAETAPDHPVETLSTERVRAQLRALADPIRLQVIEALRDGERCVCELTEQLDLAQSKLSFHLKVLKTAGLLADRQSGRWSYYRLRPEALDLLRGWLSDLTATGRSQRRIGLTGGIASGKSSAGRLLANQGLPVLDADRFAREALAPGSPGALAVLARYGTQVASDSAAASIDRGALGRIVFADAHERRWLEEQIHPVVRERFNTELNQLADAQSVVLMIPLLFETGLERLCSETWLVDCDEEQQLQRLINRDGLSEAEAQARIRAQWPLERKRELADRVINNRGGPEQLSAEVNEALHRTTARNGLPC